MKRAVIILMCLTLVAVLSAGETRSGEATKGSDFYNKPIVKQHDGNTRDFSWHITPQNMINNFFDYMPGSYCANPMRAQLDAEGNLIGLYGIFHGKETASSQRREYYFYMDGDEVVGAPTYIAQGNTGEGYGNVIIDRETNNPIFVYHTSDGSSDVGGIYLVYDAWNLLNTPGMLSTPTAVIDNTTQAGIDTPNDFDQFAWPYVYISKAPSYDVDGKRRVYVISTNSEDSDSGNDIVCENILLCWKDFSSDDLMTGAINNTPWTYHTFPYLDAMNSGTPPLGRYFHAMDVSWDGRIAIFGHFFFGDPDMEFEDAAMLFYNDNFGEGDWEMTQVEMAQPFDNPVQPDTTSLFATTQPTYWGIGHSSHGQIVLGQNDVRLLTNMVVSYNDEVGDTYTFYYWCYMKEAVMNLQTHQNRIIDLYPQGVDPDDGVMYLPWDEDGDGEFDDVNEDGSVNGVLGWPVYYHDNDDSFHENWQKYAVNKKWNWRIAMWHDGTGNKLGQDGSEDYTQWIGVPELYITIWNGLEYVEEPIVLSSNDTPELAGMIPVYWAPCSDIIDLGNGYGRVYMIFLDDNDFGSFIQDNGPQTGGMMKFCALDIYFGYNVPPSEVDPVTPEYRVSEISAYPNPFNPLTKVKYSVPEAGEATVTIHNIRGQKVKTLYNGHLTAGTHTFEWNGTDDNGTNCSTGVYLMKGTNAKGSVLTKVTLLK